MSVFLDIPSTQWVASNGHAFAIRDRFPVSPGHTLVITRRIAADWFAATPEERAAVLALVDDVKRQLDAELRPDGYNVGFNAGEAAGQTVMHLHVHVIPRFDGDMEDPRGGVRHVIPNKGNYLRSERPPGGRAEPLATGGDHDPFSRHVLPLFDTATEIAIVAAFVQESGLRFIERPVHAALARGATIRILTGDYLDITQASALEMLLDWLGADSTGEPNGDAPRPGRLASRVIETGQLRRAFHPKAWRFESPHEGVAFVGSSNLSRSALGSGIEWNLRVERSRDEPAFRRVREAFEELWRGARDLDAEWVERYAARAQVEARRMPVGENEVEPLELAPSPHRVQDEAMASLAESRAKGRRRALVVLATGLGKTWLAAFDYRQFAAASGTARPPRLLFVAHRQELLRQAAHTYRRLLRTEGIRARVGWFVGAESDLSADLVFASVTKLARAENLEKLRDQHFDYVVVDEVHHATARSYRKILDEIDPTFLLGLTATPDRADSADVLGLFDDHLAYTADIGRGIALGRLVPFHYFGVKDEIDYSNIPWRNTRFDPEVLAQAAQTEARMQTLWRAWSKHEGTRTLIFCCSVAHADFVKGWLTKRGVRTAAVYAAAGSDDRESALRQLEAGELDAVCSVDVFNEGVDVPSVDRVVMLRPTESGVLFLQQLGRGLRAADGKSAVTVIDFVGNHRVFLERLRSLLSLAGAEREIAGVRQVLESTELIELPEGCSVDLELEAKEILSRLFRVSGVDEVERIYRELRLEREARPTAGELERLGYLPSRLRQRHGSWFDFVSEEGDLAADESATLEHAGAFLRELETTEMTKCFKMILLEALLESGGLRAGVSLRALALRSHRILRRSPELFADVAEDERVTELAPASEKKWLAYWRRNPVEAWTAPKKDRRAWFRIDGESLVPAFAVREEEEPALTRLVRELVDYRLAQYRARQLRTTVTAEGFICKVLSNQRDPILKLPTVARDKLPEGETDVRVDGAVWQFRFAREFCNVAKPAGTQRNQLPDLLRRWFGPTAGQPGTAFDVRFRASPDGLWAEPVQAEVIELAARRGVVAYPDLRAAAGHASHAAEDIRPEHVMLPIDRESPDLFAVRVAGTSMDGGREPLRDGDWAIMRFARSSPSSALVNRVVLVEVPGEGFGQQYQIKRLRQEGGAWQLASDNPDGPTFTPDEAMTVIARLERAIHPEDLAPPSGAMLSEDQLAQTFGIEGLPPRSGRYGGHLFIFVDEKGMLVAPDRVRFVLADRRPGETAFVLARRDDTTYRYLGVGRSGDDEPSTWHIPDADYATWRAWGEGREASRALPAGALARAQLAADALLALPERERSIVQSDGRRARVLGSAQRGGLRVDGGGGKEGFAERTVSLVDLAWVILADDEVRERGGVLDEARVNVLRYLEGTPKGSTRWIDTGWALAAWQRAKPLVRVAAGAPGAPRKVRGTDGSPIDATFRVEPAGDLLTVVFESRGGTRGSKDERNTEYDAGLRTILERLKARGLRIADALVESRDTESLPPEQRRIQLDDDVGGGYPVTIGDAEAVRRALSAGQARVGRKPGARGAGNRTKRIRLFVEGAVGGGVEALAKLLEG